MLSLVVGDTEDTYLHAILLTMVVKILTCVICRKYGRNAAHDWGDVVIGYVAGCWCLAMSASWAQPCGGQWLWWEQRVYDIVKMEMEIQLLWRGGYKVLEVVCGVIYSYTCLAFSIESSSSIQKINWSSQPSYNQFFGFLAWSNSSFLLSGISFGLIASERPARGGFFGICLFSPVLGTMETTEVEPDLRLCLSFRRHQLFMDPMLYLPTGLFFQTRYLLYRSHWHCP